MSAPPLRRRLIAALLSLFVLAVAAPATASAATPGAAPSAAPRAAASPFAVLPANRAPAGTPASRRSGKVVAGVAVRVIIIGVKYVVKNRKRIPRGARRAATGPVRAKLKNSTFTRTFSEARRVIRQGKRRFTKNWFKLSPATRGCIYGVAQSRASRFANDGSPDYWLRLYQSVVDGLGGQPFEVFSKPSAASLAVEFGKSTLIDAGGCAAGIAYGPASGKLLPPGT